MGPVVPLQGAWVQSLVRARQIPQVAWQGSAPPQKKTTVNVSISLRMEPKRKRVEGTDSRSNSTPGFKSQGCHSLPMQPEATDFNSELKNWDNSSCLLRAVLGWY